MQEREKPYRRPPERIDDLSGDFFIIVTPRTAELLKNASRETGMSVHKLIIMACAREILIGGGR